MNGPVNRKDFLSRLKQSSEVRITVRARISKRYVSAPVWFAVDGGKAVLVPMKGSDSNWFKDLKKDPHIELNVGDMTIPLKANLVRNPKQVEKVLDKFRAKYRSTWSESYYTKRDVYVEVPV
jgi:hypothetical protein